jgi:NADH dehydrogenase
MKRVLVTGASGFVARPLIRALLRGGDVRVAALTRRPEALADLAGGPVEVVSGSLFDADRYGPHLAGVDTVVHLAAATGKARAEVFERVNAEGTARVVAACREAGVRSLLHVSTIAVTYPNVADYPYARSKQRAEEVVRAGGVPFTIVRPTIVLGAGSAAWRSFASLVRPSLVVVPGRGAVRVQPVDVGDLAAVMAAFVREGRFDGGTYDVGGPEALTLEAFLTRAHTACHGGPARVVHLPLSAILPVLSLGEQLAFSLVPATPGQFSVFRFDSTAGGSAAVDRFRPQMQPLAATLAQCCAG